MPPPLPLLPLLLSSLPPFLQQTPYYPGRSLALCDRKDDSDSSIARCDDWCKYPEHCSFCKCRACSLCKPCESNVADDIAYEGCEDWCSVHDHCDSCKCRACSFCKACTPKDETDTPFEDSQPWCSDAAHCEYCKCKASPRCRSLCTPHDGDDDDFESCQGWWYVRMSNNKINSGPLGLLRVAPNLVFVRSLSQCTQQARELSLPLCKCKGCDICRERCMPWCTSSTDCHAKVRATAESHQHALQGHSL